MVNYVNEHLLEKLTEEIYDLEIMRVMHTHACISGTEKLIREYESLMRIKRARIDDKIKEICSYSYNVGYKDGANNGQKDN